MVKRIVTSYPQMFSAQSPFKVSASWCSCPCCCLPLTVSILFFELFAIAVNDSTPVMVKIEPSDGNVSTSMALLPDDGANVTETNNENVMDDIVSDDDEDENEGLDSEDEFEEEDECDEVHPGLLCRLCANPVSDPVYIFNDHGKDLDLAAKINICLPITVSINYCSFLVVRHKQYPHIILNSPARSLSSALGPISCFAIWF